MKVFKGTPGKWEIDQSHPTKSIIGINCIDPDDYRNNMWMTLYNAKDVETQIANANLVAAAPELLTALNDLWIRSTNLFGELTIDEIENDECLQKLSSSIQVAREVVNKALGLPVGQLTVYPNL